MVPPFFITMVHIGKLIEEEFHRQERSITWFAKDFIAIEVMYMLYLNDKALIQNSY